MSRRVPGRRPGRAHLATALLGRRLQPWVFRVAGELVDELEENRGTLPSSPLFTSRVIRSLLKHARSTMMRERLHGLALARLATLLTPHVSTSTPYRARRAVILEGEAYRLYASALFRCGRNLDAHHAAEEARRLFEIPIVSRVSRKYLAILDLTSGQIVFNLGEIERGLEIISCAADNLHIVYGDVRRFLMGRQIYGSLLMYLHRWEDAVAAFDEVLEIAIESKNDDLRAATIYNMSVCGKRLQEEHADQCAESAIKLLKETGVSSDVPRSAWLRIIDLRHEGKINEAISEMYKVRQAYIDAGLELQGDAEVTPVIVETLVQEGRTGEAQFIGRRAIKKLSEAGLKFSENRITKALSVAPPPSDGATLELES